MRDLEDVSKEDIEDIGILHFEKSDQQKQKVTFLHRIFQEHAASYYMSKNDDSVKKVVKALKDPDTKPLNMDVFSSPLAFAVEIKPSLLESVIQINMPLPVVKVNHQEGSTSDSVNLDLEISYQARLLHECSDIATKQDYLRGIMESEVPKKPVILSHQPQVEVSAYIDLIDCLGLQECLILLKKVHKDEMILDEDKAYLSASGGSTTRCITDTLLLGCLPAIDIIDTDHLTIKYVNIKVLQYTVMECQWKVTLHIIHTL